MDLIEFHDNLSGGKFEDIIQKTESKDMALDKIQCSFALFWLQQGAKAYEICQDVEKELENLDPLSLIKLRISEFLIHDIKKDSAMQNKFYSMITETENLIDLSAENRNNIFWKGMLFLVKGLNKERANSEAAIELINKSLIEFQKSNHKFHEGIANFKSAKIFETLGNYPEAILRFEKAVQIWETIDSPNRVGSGLNGLGQVYRMMAEYDKATEHFEKAIEIYTKTGNKGNMAISVNNLGIVNYFRSNYRKGLEYYNQSMEIFQELKNKEGISAAYMNIAIMHAMLTEYIKAEEYFKKSLSLETEMDNTRGIGKVNNNLGNLVQMQGKYSLAMEYYDEARIHQNKVDDKFGIGETHQNTAICYNFIGETRKALEHANLALKVRKPLGNNHTIARSYKLLGDLLYKMGDMDGSINYLQKSLEMIKEIGNETQIVGTLVSLIDVYIADNQKKEAEGLAHEIVEIGKNSEDKFFVQNSKYASIRIKLSQNGKQDEMRLEQISMIDEILYDEPYVADFGFDLSLLKIELLLSRLQQSQSTKDEKQKIIKKVNVIIDDLQINVEKENNYDLQIKLFILQARMSRYLLEAEKTIAYLETAAKFAADKGLNLLSEIIELETDLQYMEISGNVEIFPDINEFERFIQDIKQDVSQFYDNTEFHYFTRDLTLCGLPREEMQKMEIEYNIPKTTFSKCSKCRQKLFEDAFHNPIVSKIISKACSRCGIMPGNVQAEQIVLNNVQRGNLLAPNYRKRPSSSISLKIDWKCVNTKCDENNEIEI